MSVQLSEGHELSSGRTALRVRGYVALENNGKTSRHDEISRIAHPSGRFARILRGGHSFRPLVDAHAAPYQLLVHRLVGSGQLLPRGSWVKPPRPELGVPFYMTTIFNTVYGACLKQGRTDSASNVPIKLRIFASCFPIKSHHFGSILKRHLIDRRTARHTRRYNQTGHTAMDAFGSYGGLCITSFLLWEGSRHIGGCRC